MSSIINRDNNSTDNYFQQCIQNMYTLIQEHNLTDEFLSVDINSDNFKNTGFIFTHLPIVSKIDRLTNVDGHSGASFACCCRQVYNLLQQETKKKRQSRAKFRGLIRAIIKLKKIRLKAAQSIYSPGGKGFLVAQKEFNRFQK